MSYHKHGIKEKSMTKAFHIWRFMETLFAQDVGRAYQLHWKLKFRIKMLLVLIHIDVFGCVKQLSTMKFSAWLPLSTSYGTSRPIFQNEKLKFYHGLTSLFFGVPPIRTPLKCKGIVHWNMSNSAGSVSRHMACSRGKIRICMGHRQSVCTDVGFEYKNPSITCFGHVSLDGSSFHFVFQLPLGYRWFVFLLCLMSIGNYSLWS